MQHISSLWTTVSKWVDVDTGEEITKHQANQFYRILKKHKYVTKDNATGKRTVIVTNECRKNDSRQQTIDFIS